MFAFVKKTGDKLSNQKGAITALEKCDLRTKFPATPGAYQEFAAYNSLAFSSEKDPYGYALIFYWFYSPQEQEGRLVALDLLTCNELWVVHAPSAVDSLDFVKFQRDPWNAQFGYLVFGKTMERDEAGLNGGFNGGKLFKIDLHVGKVVWQHAIEQGEIKALDITEKQILLSVKKHFIPTGCEECSSKQAADFLKALEKIAGENAIWAIGKEVGALSWKYKIKTNDPAWALATDGFEKVFVTNKSIVLDVNTGKIK
jgi:hypothetical protein